MPAETNNRTSRGLPFNTASKGMLAASLISATSIAGLLTLGCGSANNSAAVAVNPTGTSALPAPPAPSASNTYTGTQSPGLWSLTINDLQVTTATNLLHIQALSRTRMVFSQASTDFSALVAQMEVHWVTSWRCLAEWRSFGQVEPTLL